MSIPIDQKIGSTTTIFTSAKNIQSAKNSVQLFYPDGRDDRTLHEIIYPKEDQKHPAHDHNRPVHPVGDDRCPPGYSGRDGREPRKIGTPVTGHEYARKDYPAGKARDEHRAPDCQPPDPEVGVCNAREKPGKVRVGRHPRGPVACPGKRSSTAAGNREKTKDHKSCPADPSDKRRIVHGDRRKPGDNDKDNQEF